MEIIKIVGKICLLICLIPLTLFGLSFLAADIDFGGDCNCEK